jgi:stage V sporulation protein AE
MRRNVILITDGDRCAKKAVETATANIGGRCISKSAGNPTELTGKEIVELIKQAKHDPVIVMVDDRGNTHEGLGEKAMDYILKSKEINVLGVVAVASNTPSVRGVKVDFSIDNHGNIIQKAVDKHGESRSDRIVKGDTVDILNDANVPLIIGVGDPGKMDGFDDIQIGAPIITKAFEEIIKRMT